MGLYRLEGFMSTVIKATLARTSSKDETNDEYVYPVTTADLVYYDLDNKVTVQDKINELFEEMDGMTYEAIDATTYTVSPSYVEHGDVVSTLKFAFTFNRVPSEIKIKISSTIYNITPTLESATIKYTIKEATACVLTAFDNKNRYCTKTINIALRRRYFYGAATSFSKLTDLSYSVLASKSTSLTVNATSGKHIYYCCPISSINDVTTFNVGGFEGGFTLKGITKLTTTFSNNTFSLSNDGIISNLSSANFKNTSATSGDTYVTTQTYAVYESDNTGLGNTTFKVS
jgi:hypothetical protein